MYHSPNQPSLKLKIHKIVNDTELMKCPVALEKINTFSMRIIETAQTEEYVKKKIIKSRNFSFDRNSQNKKDIYMSTEPFEINYDIIGKKFLNKLSTEEIRTIRKNRDYYIKNNELKDNLNIFHYDTLLDRINKEDANIIIKELEDINEKKPNKHKHSYSTINTTKQRRKILKEDAFTEQNKHYEKIIQKETAKDKQRIIDNKKKLAERVKALNNIYYKSRENQEHINKVLSRKSNKKLNYQSFLITQSNNYHHIKHSETSRQPRLHSPTIKRRKGRRQSVFNPMKRKEEKSLKETVEKIKEIYTNDYYLPPI